MNRPKIGWRYRHLKRGSNYVVRGLLNEFGRGRNDGTQGFFVITQDPGEYPDGPYLNLMTEADYRQISDIILFTMPVTFQVSKPPKAITVEFVIYQSEDDGRFWARPLGEFTDGRFERIKE